MQRLELAPRRHVLFCCRVPSSRWGYSHAKSRMLVVRGTADLGYPRPGWRRTNDRLYIVWTGGIDPERTSGSTSSSRHYSYFGRWVLHP